jgi:predicted dehydrogenase
MQPDLSRRGFMAAGMAAASFSRVLGANDRVRLGIIGTGGRGSYLMTEANKCPNIQWVALCDAWDARRDEAARIAGGAVEKYADYRRLLDRRDIDAVIVATWDNLHAQITVDACRAGKDVYVEKPMTSLPMQGAEVVRAARETKRVVQVGVQQRSTPHFLEAKQRFIDSGLIGRVHMVRTVWNANGGYLTPVPPGMESKPAGLDWEACLGWLPKIPWDPKRYFNRFAYWDLSSGGQTGGLLVHMIDVVYWFLNVRKPVSAEALGGIYQYDDGRDTPDNINVILDYAENLNVTFEATITDMIPKDNEDIVFMGSGGRLSIFRRRYHFIPAGSKGPADEIVVKGGPDRHMQNWLDCVRSRQEPNANVVDGHYGAMACHIANIAYREKSRVNWKPEWDV